MITLRMVAIATAILVGIPVTTVLADHAIGHVFVPGGEVVNAGLEAAATVTDITLVEMPRKLDRVANEFRPEQLVEGHIVFVTIDIPLVENVTNFTFDIVGDVECHTDVSGEGEFFRGLPIPRRIDRAHVECSAGGVVFVTPDPFMDPSSTSSRTPMLPTGHSWPATAPNGEEITVTEHVFAVTTTDWMGEQTQRTYYAWSVPVLDRWTHPDDGRPKSWFCPIPEDRLLEMGVTTFRAYHESELPTLRS